MSVLAGNRAAKVKNLIGSKERKAMDKLRATQPQPRRTQVEVVETPSGLGGEAVVEISGALRLLLADVFALYLKSKNFHWHMSGPHFRDYHLLLDEQSAQIFAMTDEIAERARKIGATTLRSIGDIAKHQRVTDNDSERVAPEEMLTELRDDNRELTRNLRSAHELCDRHRDVATASLIEN